MSDKIKKGKAGEDLATDFLISNGYDILERNYRHGRSEIDLIVKKDTLLVFVEVKLRSSDDFGFPEEFVDEKKVNQILTGAEHYIYTKQWMGNVRYDIIAIRASRQGPPEIKHIEDAFY